MKKRYLLYLLLLIPFNVHAASMSVSCNKTTAEPSSTVNCTVSIFDTEVSGGEGLVSVTNGTIKNVSKNQCGYGTVSNDKFACVDDVQDKSMALATYTIELGSEGTTTFNVSGSKVVGEGFSTISVNNVSASIAVVQPKQEEKIEAKVEDKKQNIIAAKPEEKEIAVEEVVEEPTEELTEEIEVKEQHGLKKFTILGKEYLINDEKTYTIEVETNETNIGFKYETLSSSDKVTISEKTIKDGFNKLVIKCSYEDQEDEYTIYLYKKPLVKQESNFMKYALSFICGFLLGIAISLLMKLKNKKNNNNKKEEYTQLLTEEKEVSLAERFNQ